MHLPAALSSEQGHEAPCNIRDFRSSSSRTALLHQRQACQVTEAAQAALSLCMAMTSYQRRKLPIDAPALHLGVSVKIRVCCGGVVGPCNILINATSCFPVVKKHGDDLLAGSFQHAVLVLYRTIMACDMQSCTSSVTGACESWPVTLRLRFLASLRR